MRQWTAGIGVLALVLGACGPARIMHEAGMRISAQDALREANLQAVSWDASSTLRFIEGEQIASDGAIGDEGLWRFAFEAPSKTDQLVVTITSAKEEHRTRARVSPPGYVLGNATLGTSWIDSKRALEVARANGLPADTPVSMLLVATTPVQWVVRAGEERWRVNAATGEFIGR